MPKPLNISSKSMTKTVSSLSSLIPSVWFTDYAWAKLWTIIDLCPKEVGWFGLVDTLDSGDYLISDIFVPEQTVTAAETDIPAEAMGALAIELESKGIDSSKLRYWGHSHVNMSVGPSGTDEDQVAEYIEHVDFFIRGIHNKKGASKVDIYDCTKGLIYQCVDTGRQPAMLSNAQWLETKAEIDKNVTEYVPPRMPTYQYHYSAEHARVNSRQANTRNANVYDLKRDEDLQRLMEDPFGVKDDFSDYV